MGLLFVVDVRPVGCLVVVAIVCDCRTLSFTFVGHGAGGISPK